MRCISSIFYVWIQIFNTSKATFALNAALNVLRFFDIPCAPSGQGVNTHHPCPVFGEHFTSLEPRSAWLISYLVRNSNTARGVIGCRTAILSS